MECDVYSSFENERAKWRRKAAKFSQNIAILYCFREHVMQTLEHSELGLLDVIGYDELRQHNFEADIRLVFSVESPAFLRFMTMLAETLTVKNLDKDLDVVIQTFGCETTSYARGFNQYCKNFFEALDLSDGIFFSRTEYGDLMRIGRKCLYYLNIVEDLTNTSLINVLEIYSIFKQSVRSHQIIHAHSAIINTEEASARQLMSEFDDEQKSRSEFTAVGTDEVKIEFNKVAAIRYRLFSKYLTVVGIFSLCQDKSDYPHQTYPFRPKITPVVMPLTLDPGGMVPAIHQFSSSCERNIFILFLSAQLYNFGLVSIQAVSIRFRTRPCIFLTKRPRIWDPGGSNERTHITISEFYK